MKFKYNIPKNTFKMYGEANYVFVHQKEYLTGSNKKIQNFYIEPIVLSIILFILNIIFNFINESIADIINVIFVLCIIYLFVILISYFNYKNNLRAGELKVDKKGITDISDIIITFPWYKVKLIGITNNMMVILSESSTIMFLIEPNEELLEEILKYKEVTIIRNN
ncbi:MAG: hypothetical protein E7161_00970 [Firmicutes bacterium]|nr:hypothetical protein [Bacillota bacterium]